MENKNVEKKINGTKVELMDVVHKASHDLKGPLRTIKAFTQLLENSMATRFSDEEKGLVGFIMEATDNLENLILKLIDYSKAGLPLDFSEFKANDLLQVLVLQNQKQIEELKIDVQIYCDDFKIKADKSKLNSVFENLFSNSLKFINKSASPEIKITVTENPDHFKFVFWDSGIGIETDKMDKAFDILERLHGTTEYKGAGVGLALCKKIVDAHNGSITINSEFNKFTEVSFTIPKM